MGAFSVHELTRFSTPNGGTWRAVRQGDPDVGKIRETYFSWVDAGCTKAWRMHKLATCNFVVPVGNVDFVVREKSGAFTTVRLGVDNYMRLTVFPGHWFGFSCRVPYPALVVNSLDLLHDDEESEKAPEDRFDFDWSTT